MENKEIGEHLSLYMWHVGKILAELLIVGNTTDSPIIVQTFRAAGELFDMLIRYKSVGICSFFYMN